MAKSIGTLAALAALTALGIAAAPARAQAPQTPLAPAEAVKRPAKSSDPGFAADVERALDDLTELQCTILGVLLINPGACQGP